MKINFGCGDRKKDGYVNVDICGEPDVRADLSVYPWPFESDCADEILSEHFLEHVKDFEATIFEMHRILKPGGVLHFKVPHFKSPYFPWHVHLQSFSCVTCRLLCAQLPYVFKGKKLFDYGKIRLNYPTRSRVATWILSSLANISPMFWEYVGLPIFEIEFWCTKAM